MVRGGKAVNLIAMSDGEEKKPVWVIGHRNPDTDAICAAVGYAAFLQHVRHGLFDAFTHLFDPGLNLFFNAILMFGVVLLVMLLLVAVMLVLPHLVQGFEHDMSLLEAEIPIRNGFPELTLYGFHILGLNEDSRKQRHQKGAKKSQFHGF